MTPFTTNTIPILPLTSVAVASTLLVLHTTRKRQLVKHAFIPSPAPCYPLVGHLLSMGSTPLLQVDKWHKKLGPLIRLKIGVQNWIFIGDPGVKTSGRPSGTFGSDIYASNGRGIAFSINNNRWKHLRAAALSVLKVYGDDFFRRLVDNALKQNKHCMVKDLEKMKTKMGDLIIVGTDTTSVTFRWAIAILANHMETLRVICKELDDVIRTLSRLTTVADRDHLPYMISVRICPGVYLAETELVIVNVKLFASHKILPASNDKLSDLDDIKDNGFVITPAKYSVRFAKRGDAIMLARRKRQTERKLLPGEIPIPVPSPCFPLVGHLLSLESSPILQLRQWQEQLGPLIRLKMGVQNWIFIGDPLMAHDIYMVNGAKTSGRPLGTFGADIYARGGRGIIFSTNDKKWKNTRKAALAILAQNKVDDYEDKLQFEAKVMVDNLTKDSKDINPMEIIHCATYNSIMRTVFATRAESTKDPLFQKILHLVEFGTKYAGVFGYIGLCLPWMAWYDWITRKTPKMKRFIKTYRDDTFRTLTDNALKQDQDCMAKQLCKLKDEFGLDDMDIIVILSDLIGAGTDTTSVAASWAIAILAHHMETQELIFKELDDFIRTFNRLPTFADRNHLPYMISVQRECLRFCPILPFNFSHMVTEDFNYKGYRFYKGDHVLSNLYYMHKSSDAYDEPDSFKPDRFIHQSHRTMLGSASGNIHQRDQYSFGWGRRICPGIYLAETQLFLMYVQLFSQHKILPASDGALPDLENFVDHGTVYTPVDYSVRFAKRDDAVALVQFSLS